MAKYALALVLILGLLGAMAYRMISISRLAPPQHVKHFDQFVDWNPDIERYRVGESSSGPVLLAEASGGPTYVFDNHGLLVEWTASTTPSFEQKWGASDRSVDLDGARHWLDNHLAPESPEPDPMVPEVDPDPMPEKAPEPSAASSQPS